MKTTLLAIAVSLSACGKSKSSAVACDATATNALAASLDKANGTHLGNAYDDPKNKADMAAATKELTGKKFAFTGCKFDGQGNDMVSFTASNGDKSINCHMKGGEDGVTKFRHAAMAI